MSKNLREFCLQRGSILKVCREIGINRQQFNRYLNGETIPRKEMIQKICDYFEISAFQLFCPPDSDYLFAVKGDNIAARPEFSEFINSIEKVDEKRLPAGMYYAYTITSKDSSRIVRSLTIVKHQHNYTHFRRLVGHAENRQSPWYRSKRDHQGIILERSNFFYFAAVDKLNAHAPTLMIMHWAPVNRLLSGSGTVLTRSGSEIVKIVMEPIDENITVKSALKKCVSLETISEEIPGQIRHMLIGS